MFEWKIFAFFSYDLKIAKNVVKSIAIKQYTIKFIKNSKKLKNSILKNSNSIKYFKEMSAKCKQVNSLVIQHLKEILTLPHFSTINCFQLRKTYWKVSSRFSFLLFMINDSPFYHSNPTQIPFVVNNLTCFSYLKRIANDNHSVILL